MVAPFSQAAFSLQPFQMSDVVKTQFGYHLILVTERKPGREVKFEDVKEMVKEELDRQMRERKRQAQPALSMRDLKAVSGGRG